MASTVSPHSAVAMTAGRQRRQQQRELENAVDGVLDKALSLILPSIVREAHPIAAAQTVYAKRRVADASPLNIAIEAYDRSTTSFREWRPLAEQVAQEVLEKAAEQALEQILKLAVKSAAREGIYEQRSQQIVNAAVERLLSTDRNSIKRWSDVAIWAVDKSDTIVDVAWRRAMETLAEETLAEEWVAAGSGRKIQERQARELGPWTAGAVDVLLLDTLFAALETHAGSVASERALATLLDIETVDTLLDLSDALNVELAPSVREPVNVLVAEALCAELNEED